MIYLATPYSHPDPKVMEARFDRACRVAGYLMLKGRIVFSPIIHCHPIATRCKLPRDAKYWHRYKQTMLDRASRLVVVMMDGWKESVGVTQEIKMAQQIGLTVCYISDPGKGK